MENSVRESEELIIPKKPRSLDVQNLYVVKSEALEEGEGGGVLKRKRRSSVDEEFGSGQGKNRRKSLKDVTLSGLESVNKKSRSSSNAVDGLKLSEDRKDFGKKSKDGISGEGHLQNLQKLNGITDISANLGDNAFPIPKGPRCFSRKRRKTFESNNMSKDDGDPSKVSSDSAMGKAVDNSVTSVLSSEGKQKKVLHEFKASNSSTDHSVRSFSASGASVRNVDLISSSVRRNRGKRRESKLQEHSQDRVETSVGNFTKLRKDLEDDEENLEENAARMLSSRFDPSCTVFSGSGSVSASQSPTAFSVGSSVRGEFASTRGNHSPGLESFSVDAAGRILRPRNKGREKRGTRKRRHFYEILSRDVDAYWVVDQRIKVFWPLDESWYFGRVIGYDPEKKLHHVKYDDREEEWINLQNERFKLLLLPSEVPRKSASKQSAPGGKHVSVKNEEFCVEDNDNNCSGSFMDSEPIISWLARSTRRVKSSPLGILKKQKTHSPSKIGDPPVLSDDSFGTSHGFWVDGTCRVDTHKLSNDSELPERSADEEMAEKSAMKIDLKLPDRSADVEMAEKSTVKSASCAKIRGPLELPYRSADGEMAGTSTVRSALCANIRDPQLVYFRKRFRRRDQSPECRSLAFSNSHHSSVNNELDGLKARRVYQFSGVEDMDPACVLWSGKNLGLLRLTVCPMKSKQVKLKLTLPLRLACLARGSESTSVYRTLLLLQCGKVMVTWPKVQLQMLFVDNFAGLRFLLFEGCLTQAVAFVCLVLVAFNQPCECKELVDLQLPATSIRFDLSGSENLGRPLVFTFYNFSEVKNSKWSYLDGKLKPYCSVTKQLPLAECTYDNIKILQSQSSQLPVPSVSEEPVSLEVSCRRSRQGSMFGLYKESANANMALSSPKFIQKPTKLPPFVLPFSAAPTFFLSLHLKLLMAKNVASINFSNPVSSLEAPENSGELIADDYSLDEEASDQVTVENDTGLSLTHDASGSGLVSCAESKVEVDPLSIINGSDWTKSSQKFPGSEFVMAETSVGPPDLVSMPSIPEDHSPEANPKFKSHLSHRNSIQVEIPEVSQVESQSYDVGSQSARQSRSDLVWNVEDCAIRSPNPTAPRSIWHRNRHNSGSLSFSYRSKIWPDGNEDQSQTGLVSDSRKPRSQVSYLLPFGNYDFSPRPRSHHRKGHPYKKIRTDGGKRVSGSISPQRHPELLSCDANLLITEGDRGWREYGVHVVLECVDRNDWRILVKNSGVTRYSYKAYQFLQPGATNRYTHAMMWKGGKDWILEFPDRSQWTLFKEMHEECYNRNIRAASVKSIPIPGVRLIEDNHDSAAEVPFFRSSPKYFRQVETEVEMALNPTRVLYDIESDDEEWISKIRTSDACANSSESVSEEMFERIMDMFEKVAYAQQRDNFSSDEIEELMVEVGPIHVVNDIYEYWQQKRQRKGMPLIRQFQPPMWERYQQQLKHWESAVNKIHHFGCKEKGMFMQKPPMYAFCLRPRGLEVLNKGPKQRSHRKLSTGGHSYSFSRDPYGFGRRPNGFVNVEERFGRGQNHDSLYASSWNTSTRVLSPRDAGYLSMSSDGSERNQHQTLHRSKSKRVKTFISSSDSRMVSTSYNQRPTTNRRNGASSAWNVGVLPEWPSQKQYHHQPPEGFQRHGVVDKLGGTDLDEFRLRDASGAAQHASNMAKLKREKAQRLLYRADLAIHKAMVALMTAEAIKASSEDFIDNR